jgi:hypothetical protein
LKKVSRSRCKRRKIGSTSSFTIHVKRDWNTGMETRHSQANKAWHLSQLLEAGMNPWNLQRLVLQTQCRQIRVPIFSFNSSAIPQVRANARKALRV